MWLFTTFGFFSVVQKEGDDQLTVRSRARGDLLRLRRFYLQSLSEPVAHQGTDYPWRARCTHVALVEAMPRIIVDLTYPNFKDAVALSHGPARAKRYGKVWHALYGMHDDWPEPERHGFEGLPWPEQGPHAGARTFGAVVVDRWGRFLLREQAGARQGWTFATATPRPGEAPRQTALRAVQAQMGVAARILLPLPGQFGSPRAPCHIFLTLVGDGQADLAFASDETARLRWVLPDEAAQLLAANGSARRPSREARMLETARLHLPAPAPYVRTIACPEDWPCHPMPMTRVELPYRRRFVPAEMAQIVRGFVAHVQEQRWCMFFDDGVLHIHRSWTGLETYRVHLMPCADGSGDWEVVRTELNTHPGQCGLPPQEALEDLPRYIEPCLLSFGEAKEMDSFVMAFMEAFKPNYLGNPKVVRDLLEPLLAAVAEHADQGLRSSKVTVTRNNVVRAMTDSPVHTRIPWHSREELGQALIHVFALPPDPEGQVALTTLLRDALDQVVARLCDWHLQPLPAPQLAERQAALRTYLVRVLMGTQTLHHGSQRFADLFP